MCAKVCSGWKALTAVCCFDGLWPPSVLAGLGRLALFFNLFVGHAAN